MSYTVRDFNYERPNDFIIDSDEDVSTLPTSATGNVKTGKGSMALSIESGSLFILNSDDEWVTLGGTDDDEQQSGGGES